MSQKLANLIAQDKRKNLTRAQQLALHPDIDYGPGRTKQSYADECCIEKIMARFQSAQAASHIQKHQVSYADYSDYDFHEATRTLTRGREIFDDLPAEIRREFNQSPQEFFQYVNQPGNLDRLPGLAAKGNQYQGVSHLDADQAAAAAAREPATDKPSPDLKPDANASPEPSPAPT